MFGAIFYRYGCVPAKCKNCGNGILVKTRGKMCIRDSLDAVLDRGGLGLVALRLLALALKLGLDALDVYKRQVQREARAGTARRHRTARRPSRAAWT